MTTGFLLGGYLLLDVFLIFSNLAIENKDEYRNCDNNIFSGRWQYANSVVFFITLFVLNFSSIIAVHVMFWLPYKVL